jgi:hypothetical protein
MTNPIRGMPWRACGFKAKPGLARGLAGRAEMTAKATFGRITCLGAGCSDGNAE